MDTVSTKSVFASRTLWVNIAMIVVYALTLSLDVDVVKNNPQATLIVGMVVNLINMVLRTLTDRPVSVTGGDIRTLKRK